MNEGRQNYEAVPFPMVRRAITDFLHEGHQRHTIHLLTEVDVTRPRSCIREHKARTGESVSFTAFVTVCAAKAVDENKQMHAYRNAGNKLILFDEVDVAVPVERELMKHTMGVTHVIRAANRKSLADIHHEIRTAQLGKAEETSTVRQRKWLFLLPTFVRKRMWVMMKRFPHTWKRFGGTIGISAVGMFGRGAGWGIPIASHTLNILLGGVGEKPGIVDGRIEAREYLDLTISADHDIIDGAPLARFASRLKELLEGCYGLDGLAAGHKASETA